MAYWLMVAAWGIPSPATDLVKAPLASQSQYTWNTSHQLIDGLSDRVIVSTHSATTSVSPVPTQPEALRSCGTFSWHTDSVVPTVTPDRTTNAGKLPAATVSYAANAAPTLAPVAPAAVPVTATLGEPRTVAATTSSARSSFNIRPGDPVAVEPATKITVRAQPVASSILYVFLTPGTDGMALAKLAGLTTTGPMTPGSNSWVMTAASPEAAGVARLLLSQTPGVEGAYNPPQSTKRRPMAFTPNDPLFYPGSDPAQVAPGSTSSTTFPGQWHLINNMPGTSTNLVTISAGVSGAWANDFTGAGVTIAIVDDAIEIGHKDLVTNNTSVSSLNRYFNASGNAVAGNDPTPDAASSDNHGTSVAGVAAARGGNGIGGTGAAPLANLVGIRTNLQDSALISAINHANGINPLTSIQVKNHSYGYTAAFLSGTDFLVIPLKNSSDAGTVNVFAAGNQRGGKAADSNKQSPQNSPFVIVVAALGSNGKFANYSNYGASVLVTAPSNSQFASQAFTGITTTDRTGSLGYNTSGASNFPSTSGDGNGLSFTNTFGGTSSASPLVAGVVALTIQANPSLLANSGNRNTTRAIKHLIVRTSTQIDAADATATSDGGWRTNANGINRPYNQNYGYGLINAAALTTAAPLYFGVTPLTTANSGTIFVNTVSTPATILDNNAAGVTRTFTMNIPAGTVQPLEEVVITINASHTFPGDLLGYLTSPSGFKSRFVHNSTSDSEDLVGAWQFTMNGFWGEMPNGTWTINLADVDAGVTGTWSSYSVEFRMGTLVPVPEPTTILFTSGGLLFIGRWVLRRRKASSDAPAVSL
jgi:subtilisin family serine protease